LSMRCSKKTRQSCVRDVLLIAAAFGCFALKATAETPAPTVNAATQTVPPLILSGKSAAADRASEKISPLTAEIIKLMDAKVGPAVVKAFIQNAPMAYNPSATELITLQERGAGTDILIALLQHGAEVMARTGPSQSLAQLSGTTPVYRFVPQTAYQSTVENASASSETSYPTNYETGISSPEFYAAPIYYPGFGPPGYPPDGRRPGLRDEGRRPPNGEPPNHPGSTAPAQEGRRTAFASPPGQPAPGGAHGTPSRPSGHPGGSAGGHGPR